MSIKILPARLANQIAAGEVVERPSSVVKELVENSLDAGATIINIEIDNGGAKRIFIKDNGKGVIKEELTLALSRHATSKISNLDDLEAIVSLGFRGEALASISSVSRLTFASKPLDQDQAWKSIAEGRDMKVDIQPTAHSQGTSVEVLDLFFNTPARRRFLKTEKTEFQHIDELIKRIALSRFEITFTLKHNGKLIRQYRAAQTQIQKEKRLGAICSDNFIKGALDFSSMDQDLKIFGWVTDENSGRASTDVQYCYVNGRVIRDKLITHAVKQAYAYSLPNGLYPGYVIFIECPASQVDVNVHPSKHEVRFHQSRYVHDFITNTISKVLSENSRNEGGEPINSQPDRHTPHNYSAPIFQAADKESFESDCIQKGNNNLNGRFQSSLGYSSGTRSVNHHSSPLIDNARIDAYCEFLESSSHSKNIDDSFKGETNIFGEPISLIDEKYLLIKQKKGAENQSLLIFSLERADFFVKYLSLLNAVTNGEVISQPLLLPVRLQLSQKQQEGLDINRELLIRLGFVFKTQIDKLIVSKVPTILRQSPVAQILPSLLEHMLKMESVEIKNICVIMVKELHALIKDNLTWTMTSANLLLGDLAHTMIESPDEDFNQIFQKADLSLLVQGFTNEKN